MAELVLLCLFLPPLLGRGAERALSEGVSFSGLRLAVTAPEGDETPRLLERYIGSMGDIRQYCRLEAMEREAALTALAAGEVTAVLELPAGFIQGILWGDNPDVRIIVDGGRPLESLLTLWVGQSASDLLAAFQAGIYAVLELYDASPPAGLSRDEVVLGINLRYSTWTLNRQDLFRLREVSATRTLPVALHYALALLAYLALASAPLFVPVYGGDWLRFQRRLRCAGRGGGLCWLSAVLAGAAVLLALIAPALLLTAGGPLLPLLGAACLMALFCALFGSLCCLLTGAAAGCGVLAFCLSLAWLAASGGILPPALLPRTVRELAWLSPVTWLQSLAALPLGYEAEGRGLAAMAAAAALMAAASLVLYRRRMERQEAGL